MAVTESREIVIEATPDEILDVLFDLESLTEWSSVHRKVEILERDDQGRPSKSRQVVKIVGVSDEQVLAYAVHDNGVSWTLVSAKQQRAQEGRYTLTPDADSTRVRFELTVDLLVPLPGFLIKRGAKGLMDTATQGLRMVLSRVFDAYPGLQIILGHMGEGLPFYLWRINHSLSRFSKQGDYIRDTFRDHFYVTTSGFFSDPALRCCIDELGIDRVMFSVDYPYVDNLPGANWIEAFPLAPEEKRKILSANAKRLLKIA